MVDFRRLWGRASVIVDAPAGDVPGGYVTAREVPIIVYMFAVSGLFSPVIAAVVGLGCVRKC